MKEHRCSHCGNWFEGMDHQVEADLICPKCRAKAPDTIVTPPEMPAHRPPMSRLAIASLVLGILSMTCLAPIFFIPALITGGMARKRIRLSQGRMRGNNLAMAGMIMGSFGAMYVIIGVVASVTLPGLARIRAAARNQQCQANLKQVGLEMKRYAAENSDNMFPPLSSQAGCLMFDRAAVYPKYILHADLLACPEYLAQNRLWDNSASITLIDDGSYFYLGYPVTCDEDVQAYAEVYRTRMRQGLPMNEKIPLNNGRILPPLCEGVERFTYADKFNPPATPAMPIPVLIERPGNHFPPGGNVLYLDGFVEYVPYPGRWPMTEKTISTLESLDEMGSSVRQ